MSQLSLLPIPDFPTALEIFLSNKPSTHTRYLQVCLQRHQSKTPGFLSSGLWTWPVDLSVYFKGFHVKELVLCCPGPTSVLGSPFVLELWGCLSGTIIPATKYQHRCTAEQTDFVLVWPIFGWIFRLQMKKKYLGWNFMIMLRNREKKRKADLLLCLEWWQRFLPLLNSTMVLWALFQLSLDFWTSVSSLNCVILARILLNNFIQNLPYSLPDQVPQCLPSPGDVWSPSPASERTLFG